MNVLKILNTHSLMNQKELEEEQRLIAVNQIRKGGRWNGAYEVLNVQD